jgi:hypothetical protein
MVEVFRSDFLTAGPKPIKSFIRREQCWNVISRQASKEACNAVGASGTDGWDAEYLHHVCGMRW